VPQAQKRVVVDGMELGQIFQFHRILSAVVSAMQPARMIIALLMITALITFGKIWDGLARPTVDPDGLAVVERTGNDRSLQNSLQEAVVLYSPARMPSADRSTWPELDARRVQSWMRHDFPAVRDAEQNAERRTAIEQRYRQLFDYIERRRPKGAYESTAAFLRIRIAQLMQSTLQLQPSGVIAALGDMLIGLPTALWRSQTAFTIVFGLFSLLVLSVGGGAISRAAAAQFALRKRLSSRQALDYALPRAGTFMWAQGLPLLIMAILSLVLMVAGLIMRIPAFDALGGLAYGLALILGLLIAFLLIGYIVGFALIVPSVACESSDGADAVQRAYAYVVGKPLHLLGYWIVKLIGLAIGLFIASLLAAMTINITATLFGWWAHNPAVELAGGADPLSMNWTAPSVVMPNWHTSMAASAIGFWTSLAICLVWAYGLSYCFSAATIVYLLIRQAVDGQEASDIWQPEPSNELRSAAAEPSIADGPQATSA
jgi:hypothetical protein